MRQLFILFILLIITSVFMFNCEGASESQSLNTLDQFDEMLSSISDLPIEDISIEESESLSYIREEEKLARDVYIVLFQKWNMRVFNNISGSEQKHTSAIKLLLEKYTLEDPATEEIGLFTNPELQSLYNALISKGDSSLVQALLVGAAIEEIDIIDIQDELDNVIDNQDITIVYENLLSGSANHLRAFVRNLEMSGVDYTPQYLNEETYYHILSN